MSKIKIKIIESLSFGLTDCINKWIEENPQVQIKSIDVRPTGSTGMQGLSNCVCTIVYTPELTLQSINIDDRVRLIVDTDIVRKGNTGTIVQIDGRGIECQIKIEFDNGLRDWVSIGDIEYE